MNKIKLLLKQNYTKPLKIFTFLLISLNLNNAQAAFSCNATIPTVAFGTFVPFANTAKLISVNASVTCSGALISLLVNYTLTLNMGSSGTYSPRKMLTGVNPLSYNLYKNSGRTQILGNGTAGTVTITDSYLLALGAPVTRNYTIYATIPAQPLAHVGNYTDTITASVSY